MSQAPKYSLLADFGENPDPKHIVSDVHWVVAVVRLGQPLSFSRATMSSVTKDLSQGALLRAELPLVITDDCTSLNITNSKGSPTKQMHCVLKQTDTNYLVEILGSDWVFAWIVNNKSDYLTVIDKLKSGQAANDFNSGLKFVGRIHNVRKHVSIDPEHGTKSSNYSVQAIGFSELDTQFYYDQNLAPKDVLQRDYGAWLARLGIEVEAFFGQIDPRNGGIQPNNVNLIIPTLLNLIVGKGGNKDSIQVVAADNQKVQADAGNIKEADYAYTIPVMAAQILGKDPSDASKPAKVLGYSDILELTQGIQHYSNREGWQVFIPDIRITQGGYTDDAATPNRHRTPIDMFGTFLPMFPQVTNRPMWSVFQGYLNSTINEMYTSLRVNPEGKIVPQMIMRQIPFTTNAFDPRNKETGELMPVTRFLELPRWVAPDVMIRELDIGRSDATRINFVHIYGTASALANNNCVANQMIENPPRKDDLDIIRSGLRPYMATVECFISDTVGKAPRIWMDLVTDMVMGSHLTYNGTVQLEGVQSPIVEGDNFELDNVVYHIESVAHAASIDFSGRKHWRTTLTLTNGMRGDSDGTENFPLYPGLLESDSTHFDPGLSLEQVASTGDKGKVNAADTIKLNEGSPFLTDEDLLDKL